MLNSVSWVQNLMSQQQFDNTQYQKQYGFSFGTSTKGKLFIELINVPNNRKTFYMVVLAISWGDAAFWYVIGCPILAFNRLTDLEKS